MTIFMNSPRTRSAETIDSRSACAVIASTTSSATSKPSWAEKRAARIIRSGSSVKESCAVPGVRMIPAVRSACPPNRSTKARSGSRIAIALMVKSRRTRSPWRECPKSTCGLRESASYCSARYVVISTSRPATRAPIVPNRMPTSHVVSAKPSSSASTASGRASVVKSRSASLAAESRPRRASRTGPPTRASSCPAVAKSCPMPVSSPAIGASSATARRWASVTLERESGATAAERRRGATGGAFTRFILPICRAPRSRSRRRGVRRCVGSRRPPQADSCSTGGDVSPRRP